MEGVLLSMVAAVAFAFLFATEGLVLGKLLQPAVFFVAYVTLLSPPWPFVGFVLVVSAIGATGGQWALYRAFTPDKSVPIVDRWLYRRLEILPRLIRRWMGQRWVGFVERQVERFGTLGIVACTAVPGIRTLVPIVVGVGDYPDRRYVTAAAVGNLLYMFLLLGAAWGVLGLSQLFVGV